MKFRLLLVFAVFIFCSAHGQYFHESADLYYNLRKAVPDHKKAVMGISTYSTINFMNTIPNVLDNFRFASRINIDSTKKGKYKNLELGFMMNGFISGKTIIPYYQQKPPINVRVENSDRNNNIFCPGLQMVKSYPLKSQNGRVQIGLAGYYYFIGLEDYFLKNYRFAYDLSVLVNHKILTVQGMHSAHKINSSYSFKTSDLQGLIESDKDRVSLAEEFDNITFITFTIGDYYLKRPDPKNKLVYNIYITFRRDVPSNKELRPVFELRYIDILTGLNFRFGKFHINPEVMMTNRTYDDYHAYSCLGLSMMLGYQIENFMINAGYNHFDYYQQSTDGWALTDAQDFSLDKVLLSVGYLF
ncbi:MAG TPA: hypothetical protein P5514_10950 [Bacteroidales bacterium]|nr:hypothetical protein [Bacteroidales bacterium]